jgi:hypothetical protein
LLNGSFRPDQQIRKLRTYMRLRDNLVAASTQAVHHMQKALFEMNVQLSNVISDIVGETGLRIIEAIITGQRDPMQLAALCSTRIKASRETVAKSLHGNWDEALLFALKAALETYRFSQTKIQECDVASSSIWPNSNLGPKRSIRRRIQKLSSTECAESI